MIEIESKDLGFVAFVLMQDGTELQRYDKNSRLFYINSPISRDVISMMYLNSCCRRHDSLVIHLKQLIIGG